MASQYSVLEINLFDNTNGVDTCCSCKTFDSAWIYCPIFNHIMKDDSMIFDETGELNRCELHSKNMIWECKYCGDNENPKCHKCVREDGKSVSDELA